MKLKNFNAINALNQLLQNSNLIDDWESEAICINRLKLALTQDPQKASPLDLAVLLRQVIIYENFRRQDKGFTVKLSISNPKILDFENWGDLSLITKTNKNYIEIKANPWIPKWLVKDHHNKESFFGSVDTIASSETQVRQFNSEDCKGDNFLKSIGRTNYKSRVQRSAVRTVLSTPPGSDIIISIPTGEGKSIIFQLISKINFLIKNEEPTFGVTLVIVPTVALGINHEEEAIRICGMQPPLCYQSGSDEKNSIIRQNISEGHEGLYLLSPEAACQTLREPIKEAAKNNKIRAIVIDEAHLVDHWGNDFRTEFQELAVLLREIRDTAPIDKKPRLIMLSATITEASYNTLTTLFGSHKDILKFSFPLIRPEPDYWVSEVKEEDERDENIIEALYHLPRPTILYVTEVSKAEDWYKKLKKIGYKRIGMMHGKTSTSDREDLVNQWKNGELDLVVATSAFGLGIDYPFVRSVVHACIPETLDRFYQEVGRGGRDGKKSISILCPAKNDYEIAKSIGHPTIISIDRGFQRWETMFNEKINISDNHCAVRIDIKPGYKEKDIDMVGDRNTSWHLRTLLLMHRSKIISLLGDFKKNKETFGKWLEIKINNPHHLDKEFWKQKINPERQEILNSSNLNFDLMKKFIEEQTKEKKICQQNLFKELYFANNLNKPILGKCLCKECRNNLKGKIKVSPYYNLRIDYNAVIHPKLKEKFFDLDGRLLIIYRKNELKRVRQVREILKQLQKLYIGKLIIVGEIDFKLEEMISFANDLFFCVLEIKDMNDLYKHKMQDGPEIIFLGSNINIDENKLKPRGKNYRIFIVPSDQKIDGRPLEATYKGRILNFKHFEKRMNE